jgi:hypothetical protein
MKITPVHYKELETSINEVSQTSKAKVMLEMVKAKQLSPMGYRWNLFHMVGDSNSYALANELWEYLDDNNIDTALRKITGVL